MAGIDLQTELDKLRQLHTAGVLTDALYQAALKGLGVDPDATFDQQNQQVQAQTNIAGDATTASGERSLSVGGNVQGSTFYTGDVTIQHLIPTPQQPACDPADALACYLTHVIEENSRLQLQGIRSASGLVSIALEEVYITLTATVRKTVTEEEAWLEEIAGRAPGEAKRRGFDRPHESVQQVKVQVQEALRMHPRLVVLGDPGCGKTTLLRYLALTYARDFADEGAQVKTRLGLNERRLPVLLPLRDFARYLEKECPNVGTDGPKLLLDYLRLYFTNQNVALPPDFFETRLKAEE